MPDDEIKSLLRRNLELSRENNKLLKKLRRNLLVANIMRLVWWAVIIGVPVFLYYYIFEPYMVEVSTSLQGVQNSVSGAQNMFLDIPFVGDLIERFADTKATVTPVAE